MREEREEQILLSLKKLDYLTTSQIRRLHNLKGARNARKVLERLEPYLCHFREGENVYYLSRAGRDRVEASKVRKKTLQAIHYIMRNEAYIHFGRPHTWKNEVKVSDSNVTIKADAMFTIDKKLHFVEVDHLQKMGENRLKVGKYHKLKESGHAFKLIWITTTEYRKKQLTKLCEGLEVMIHTIADIR
jgi:hypothetical protein